MEVVCDATCTATSPVLSSLKPILLIDFPTFPKGTLSLSLPYLASVMGKNHKVSIIDLNFEGEDSVLRIVEEQRPVMVGLKVSSQNHHLAQQLSERLKNCDPRPIVVWGGEFPSLLPDRCFPFADTIVRGLFDSVAEQFLNDLDSDCLAERYEGSNITLPGNWTKPDWSFVQDFRRYNRFMGFPLETSRGCTESCTFCMVLIMQRKHYHTRPLEAIGQEIAAIGSNFINIIDYNFGVSREHVVAVCDIIARSKALGFMAEMTIELLDDDIVLEALAAAGCKMIYCGLESIDEVALKSVGKDRTNHIENYRRIIRKAQKAGVNVASGFILGMEHSTFESYRNSHAFFSEMGIIYAKLTFLTFNPGTRSQMFYRKKGRFLTEDPRHYDGNHLTFVPEGASIRDTYEGTRWFIQHFYSFRAILSRAGNAGMGWRKRVSFVLFNLCYREVYLTWLREGALRENWDATTLLNQRYRKGLMLRTAEWLLLLSWRMDKPKACAAV